MVRKRPHGQPWMEELEARLLLSTTTVVKPAFLEGQPGTLALPYAGAKPTQVSVDWGDHTHADPHAQFSLRNGTLTLTHIYAEEGKYQAAVSIHQPGSTGQPGPTQVLKQTLQVGDAPLRNVTGVGTLSAQPGVRFTGPVASFQDTNLLGGAADFKATITWGDGTKSTSSDIRPDLHVKGLYHVWASHVYSRARSTPYAVSVAIADRGGSSGTATSAVTVSAPTVSMQISPGPYFVNGPISYHIHVTGKQVPSAWGIEDRPAGQAWETTLAEPSWPGTTNPQGGFDLGGLAPPDTPGQFDVRAYVMVGGTRYNSSVLHVNVFPASRYT